MNDYRKYDFFFKKAGNRFLSTMSEWQNTKRHYTLVLTITRDPESTQGFHVKWFLGMF